MVLQREMGLVPKMVSKLDSKWGLPKESKLVAKMDLLLVLLLGLD